jgi:hypothetical protein
MDKTTYIQEEERQLSDCRLYEKLDSDPTLDYAQKITRALEAMQFSIFFKKSVVSLMCDGMFSTNGRR